MTKSQQIGLAVFAACFGFVAGFTVGDRVSQPIGFYWSASGQCSADNGATWWPARVYDTGETTCVEADRPLPAVVAVGRLFGYYKSDKKP